MAMPLDLILGLIGQRSPHGSSGSGEFGKLLDLFGPAPMLNIKPGEGDLLSVTGLTQAPGAEPATVESIEVLLPQGMAQALGLNPQPPPDMVAQKVSADNPEPMVPIRAGLLATNDGNNQTIYLNLKPGEVDSELNPAMAQASDNGEEMVLPMRLRTVEQRGDRIFADAELQSATGKDVSVRLRLELAGNPNLNKMATADLPESPDVTVKQQHSVSKPNLPHLLKNLDVKLLVIEPAAVEINSGTASLSRGNFGDKATRAFSTPINSDAVKMALESAATVVKPISADGRGLESTGMNVGRDSDPESMQIGNTRSGNSAVAQHSGAIVESTSNILTSATALEAGGMSQSGSSAESSEVRFYQLEDKLDQLKHNPGQKIKVQLVPARLGKMELSIINQRGMVTVKLALDSMQARQIVERNLAQLESHLTSSGIRVDNFQLYVNQPSRGAAYDYQQFQYNHPQDGYSEQRGGGRNRQFQNQKQLQQFQLSGSGFEQTLVNCLA
jgi:flagellar hook-length control protein FliK